MDYSNYNLFSVVNNKVIGFNTFNDSFILIEKKDLELINSNTPVELRSKSFLLYNILKEGGFIKELNKNELDYIQFNHLKDSYNKNYDLTIIPNMDCNLKCWYCFEKHQPNSFMDMKVKAAIVNHIEKRIELNEIDKLTVEWFGGEPLLKFDEIVFPLGLKLKELCKNKQIQFYNYFITNGTLISRGNIKKLAELNPGFQITIDGHENNHNKIKFDKKNRTPTYRKVIDNIHLIQIEIPESQQTIRINYDEKTLENFDLILNDIETFDKNRLIIHLERIWQTKGQSIVDNKLLKSAINQLLEKGFRVDYGGLQARSSTCKSDRFNHAAINYDGKVYRCTGRELTQSNSMGNLEIDGHIKWDDYKVAKKLSKQTYEYDKCLKCKLLPLCMGPCSQKCMENNWTNIDKICNLEHNEQKMEDIIYTRFRSHYNFKKAEFF